MANVARTAGGQQTLSSTVTEAITNIGLTTAKQSPSPSGLSAFAWIDTRWPTECANPAGLLSKTNGQVVWLNINPHGWPEGTTFYAIAAAPKEK